MVEKSLSHIHLADLVKISFHGYMTNMSIYCSMGSATGGARGAMAPPKNGLGGPVMHLAPPIFWENSVMKHN